MKLSNLWEALTAIGTVGAVLVALFGDWIKRTVVPPRLDVELSNTRGLRIPVNLLSPDGSQRESEARFYHVRVSNMRRGLMLIRFNSISFGSTISWCLRLYGRRPLLIRSC
jgi:hypothetical protein